MLDVKRPWDARLARFLIGPLKDSWVTPNHLTTLRLGVGLAAAAAFLPGRYALSNVAALLLGLSNFIDHTVTILVFVAIGVGVSQHAVALPVAPVLLGTLAGSAIALIFFLRMRIEAMAGKNAVRQASVGGFETEDVLYLLPLVTLCNALTPFLIAASVGAPLFALWVTIDYRRTLPA